MPRVASEWDLEAPGSLWRPVQGTLLFVDVSGFTSLSERLAQRGRIGAEELTSVLNRVFGRMLEIVYGRGGSLLKFGGDALLLLFEAQDHVMQATAASVEMRAALREASKEKTSVGRINLRMSSGIHTGEIDFFLVGDSHRELIVTGPTASVTTEMEVIADSNEIVVSAAANRGLPAGFTSNEKGEGWLLRKQKIHHPACGPAERQSFPDEDLAKLVSQGLRQHLAAGISDSEHRIATIGFLEFKGVDGLLATEGPHRVGEALDKLVSAVQTAADQEGVTFLASDIDADGGKIILAAGVPRSQHDDEGRMLRAARQILDSDLGLSVRIGVNRGHVFSGNVGTGFRRTYTVMGDTVNLAARLMAAAPPGGILASPSVLSLSSTLFRSEALDPLQIKGKEQPVKAFDVFEEIGVRPPLQESELPFRGRDAELEMIVGIVDTCARVGRGGAMTISGDVGVGKSRLISEVMERCAGMDKLTIQAEPNGSGNPYWAFRDPMRRRLGIERSMQAAMAERLTSIVRRTAPHLEWALPLLGDLMHIEIDDNEKTAAIDAQFRPDRTADAVIDLLSLHSRPIALVAEDGQWLDEASVALLNKIGEAAQSRPWTVLITARGEGEFEPLGEEIKLTPLDDEFIRSIAIEMTAATPLRPQQLDDIVAKTDGNPLFLSEILRVIGETGSADELPESLSALVAKEIDTLPPLTRHILRYASVLGRSFRRSVLDELLAADGVHLDEATERELGQFVEADVEGRLRFRHAVVHDAAYEGLSYRKRRELHARAGHVIEKRAVGDPESVADYLARHYSLAGEHEKTWHYAHIAAQKAARAYANTEAAVSYQRALNAAKHLEGISSQEIADLQESRADALERAGLFSESIKAYGEALQNTSDAVRLADLRLKRARVRAYGGNYSSGLGELTRAVRLVEQEDGTRVGAARARLLSFRAVIRMMQGRPRQALTLADQARREAEKASEQEALARSLMVLDAACLTLGRPTEDDYLSRALRIYEEMGDLLGAASANNNLGERAWLSGRLSDAVDLYLRADEINRRAGNEPEAANSRANVGEVLIAQGQLEEAREVLEDASRVLRAHDSHFAVLADIHLARLALESGRSADAIEALQEALEEASTMGQTEWVLFTKAHLAAAHRRVGELESALELLDEARSEVDRGGDLYEPLIAMVRAEALRDHGDLLGALESAMAGRKTAADLGLQREESLLENLIVELQTLLPGRNPGRSAALTGI